ncbi:44046_t:CDS:2 [Gigaspora margarita]|uniref:44046_t:CDS:1 n=1 Tax=Gigaspora margarita TaxID=4874 RepID=A0ABN7VTL1_GIGMA|nr:44046_t:CDS:2 [Gigaspora margarita]
MIDEDDAFLDINKVSFNDYLNQGRIKSEWKLKTVNIKRKVYEIVNMEPPIFEGEIKSIIDTIEIVTLLLFITDIWEEETLSNVMFDRCQKIDIRIVHRTKGLKLSHSECARAPIPAKVVHDRSKCLRTLKGVLDNFLKEDLTNEDVQDSKILGIQFSGNFITIVAGVSK